MYRCHLYFYYIGRQRELLETIARMEPMERFTHTFWASDLPEQTMAAQADVILADLRDLEEAEVGRLAREKKPEADLIVLADKEQMGRLDLSLLQDVWTAPLSERELRFRFLRWQETYKQEKDAWETAQFLQDGPQDQAAGGGARPRLYMGRGAGRPGLH